MLQHKENIKNHREEPQSKFCRISKNGAPVIIVPRDENHLNNAEGATSKIQQDIPNAPSNCTLTPEKSVHHQLLITISTS